VLLEMLSGRPYLVVWARPYLRTKRQIFHILDARLGGQYSLSIASEPIHASLLLTPINA
jgi:hypothetical protein